MHHIVSDGWSIALLIREVAALYDAYSTGARSPLSDLEVQYADYAAWQRHRLQGETLEQGMRYWRERLGGPPAAGRGRVAARQQLRLSAAAAGRLRELSLAEGATLFMTLVAALKVVLGRY